MNLKADPMIRNIYKATFILIIITGCSQDDEEIVLPNKKLSSLEFYTLNTGILDWKHSFIYEEDRLVSSEISTRRFSADGLPAKVTANYEYLANGKIEKIYTEFSDNTQPGTVGGTLVDRVTEFIYTDDNFLKQVNQNESFNGRLDRSTTTIFQRDHLNRVKSYEKNSFTTFGEQLTYDDFGNLICSTDSLSFNNAKFLRGINEYNQPPSEFSNFPLELREFWSFCYSYMDFTIMNFSVSKNRRIGQSEYDLGFANSFRKFHYEIDEDGLPKSLNMEGFYVSGSGDTLSLEDPFTEGLYLFEYLD